MSQKEDPSKRKRILVAVLDWGLGHAARCVPLVKALLEEGHLVVLGANGRALELLRMEFPELLIEEFPAYNIRYISNNMIWNMAWQWPKIGRAAWLEHRLLQQLIQKHHLQVVISDSRFGCFSSKVKSIFLSHQLWIKIPIRPLEIIVNWINHWVIRRFEECWVPDWRGEHRLAGNLSRPISGIRLQYLGILSRMRPERLDEKQQVVVVLSGPEPQRSRLESLILQQGKKLEHPLVIVQGKTEKKTETCQLRPGIRIISALSGQELNRLMSESQVIICRSGYSSLMDLVRIRKPAILVPTPGQTEQEYLARECKRKQLFFTQTQKDLDLEKALSEVAMYQGFKDQMPADDLLKKAISSL